MTTIGPTGLYTATAAGSTSGTSGISGTTGSSKDATGKLDSDAFLKLLVAQLKYQDPSSPTDASQFLAQTAQFTLVQQMEAVAKSQQEMLAATQLQSATAMVGKQVSWHDAKGEQHSGVVSSVKVTNGTPTLTVGSLSVSLDDIADVTDPPAGGQTTG